MRTCAALLAGWLSCACITGRDLALTGTVPFAERLTLDVYGEGALELVNAGEGRLDLELPAESDGAVVLLALGPGARYATTYDAPMRIVVRHPDEGAGAVRLRVDGGRGSGYATRAE